MICFKLASYYCLFLFFLFFFYKIYFNIDASYNDVMQLGCKCRGWCKEWDSGSLTNEVQRLRDPRKQVIPQRVVYWDTEVLGLG